MINPCHACSWQQLYIYRSTCSDDEISKTPESPLDLLDHMKRKSRVKKRGRGQTGIYINVWRPRNMIDMLEIRLLLTLGMFGFRVYN
jgi:hypothetical protein